MDWNEWFHQPKTQDFFKELDSEKDAALDKMLTLTSTGDELIKSFYQYQGQALTLALVISLAQDRAQEENENAKRETK